MTSEKHKSFHLTPRSEMIEKQLKPRLRRLSTAGFAVAAVVSTAVFESLVWACGHFESLPTDSALVYIALLAFVLVPTFYIAAVTFATFSVFVGWMTRQEAGEFSTAWRRWPDSWLEPVEEKK